MERGRGVTIINVCVCLHMVAFQGSRNRSVIGTTIPAASAGNVLEVCVVCARVNAPTATVGNNVGKAANIHFCHEEG